MKNKEYGVLAVGELLADFISTEITSDLFSANNFERFQGGSPANLASNMARLGYKTAVIASVGNDNLGKYLVSKVAEAGVDTENISLHPQMPSSIVLVSRTTHTPDFIPYRMADNHIYPIEDALLNKTSVFHTTCWPLSLDPARTNVLDAAKRAKNMGSVLSIDLNYAEKVWPDRVQAQKVIKEYLANGVLIKLSEDDAERFFGEKMSSDDIFNTLHQWGADLICFTLGSRGSMVSVKNKVEKIINKAENVEVVDATGAGDSFWAGFLAAYLDQQTPEICAIAGANMAKIKLKTLGPITQNIDRQKLYQI